MAAAPNHTMTPLAPMLPPEILGWAPREPDGVYDSSTLYDYIDGGAEVYLNLDFRRALGRRYEKEGAPEVIADLFEMGSSDDAFGAYHHDIRDHGAAAGIGTESEYESGALAFWKGRFFVSLISLAETNESREALLGIGRHIAEAIPEQGARPALAGLLPAGGSAGSDLHFFRTHLSLNRYRFLSDRNVLGLSRQTEGILARCRPGSAGTRTGCVILVVAYPSAAEAGAGLSGLRPVLVEAEGAAGARTSGRILAAVLSGGSREEVEGILDDVTERAKEMP